MSELGSPALHASPWPVMEGISIPCNLIKVSAKKFTHLDSLPKKGAKIVLMYICYIIAHNYGRTPLTWIHGDGKPSRNEENPGNWICL